MSAQHIYEGGTMSQESRIVRVETVLEHLTYVLDRHEKRFDEFGKTLEKINNNMISMEHNFNTKLNIMETRINDKINDLEIKVFDKVNDLSARVFSKINDLEQNFNAKINTLEIRVFGKIEDLELRVENKFDILDKKIDGNFKWLIGTIVTLFIMSSLVPMLAPIIQKLLNH